MAHLFIVGEKEGAVKRGRNLAYPQPRLRIGTRALWDRLWENLPGVAFSHVRSCASWAVAGIGKGIAPQADGHDRSDSIKQCFLFCLCFLFFLNGLF